jgi:Ca2+/Na+ antiporter
LKYLIAGIALGGVLVFSRFIEPSELPGVCVFKFLTGIPCMFCGLTHAFHEISLGHSSEAMDYHPLAFLAYGVVVFFFLFTLIKAIFWKRLRSLPQFEGFLLLCLFVVFTLFWIYRLVTGQLM